MAVTPTIQNVQPVVGGSADTWGGTLNDRLEEAYVDVNALATQGNASEAAVIGKVAKAGDTLTGDLVLANVAPSSVYSAGYRGAPVISYDTDKTLALTDCGKLQRLFGSNPRTLTIPAIGTVGFPVGTVIPLRSYTTAGINWTIARSVGVVLTVAGSSVNKDCTMTPFGFGSLTHEDPNIWVLSGVGVS